jgi:hypothetical protein
MPHPLPGPGGDAGGSTGALHGVVALVLPVTPVWPAGANGLSGWVNGAASPMRACQVECPATVEVTFGQRSSDHVADVSEDPAVGHRHL